MTKKADVYSFGVVALEIVSGKSNTSYRPKNECVYLLDWVFMPTLYIRKHEFFYSTVSMNLSYSSPSFFQMKCDM